MTRSETLFQQAACVIPGGVNSPVRAFKAVGGSPVFIERANGAYLWDVDGNRYIDYVLSWGPMIAGHAHPQVLEAVQKKMPQNHASTRTGQQTGYPRCQGDYRL